MTSSRRKHRCSRHGFTKVELVAVLAMLVVGAILFAPMIVSRRTTPRRLQCMNNMRNVGLAMQNFASSNNGQLPAFALTQTVTNESGQQGEMQVGWPIQLLPALDNTALLKNIRRNATIESGTALIRDDEKKISLEVYGCPDNHDAFKQPGRLSFVANFGFISRDLYGGDPHGKHVPGSLAWAGAPGDDEATAVHAATGVFWRITEQFSPSLEYVSTHDGTSMTVMLSENLQTGNWYDTDSTRIGFGFPVANNSGRVPLGAGKVFESAERPLNTEFDGGSLTTVQPQDWRINCDLKAAIGTRPRPSSRHSGGVNVIFCDGAGKFLNENIDPHVYLKLMTANGGSFGEGEIAQASY